MSDELPAGSVSLEEEPQTPPVETPPPVVAQTPPANPEDADPDGTVVNPGGEKLVPLSALAAARQAARDAKAEVATLKPKAERVDQIVSEWQAAQPILERAKQLAQQPPPPAPKGPLSDQEAMDYAKDLDLYKADGTPDTDRAQRLASRQQAIAEKQAQQYVQPLIQHTAQGQSRANFEQAANFKQPQTNIQVDREILTQVWNSVPPEMSAQPNVAAVLWQTALGQMVIQGKLKPGTAPPPPVVETASIGGSVPVAASLNAMDHSFRTAADMSEKDFTATREKYQAGRVNSLE